MPKRVDHAERRAVIADAVLAVVARGGIEQASVRHVAAEAGVSAGMVQHYFRTKDELMRAAMERVGAAVERRLSLLPADTPPRELLRALFRQLLPLDDERAREGRVALAFLAHAAVDPAAAGELRDNGRRMRAYVAGQVPGGVVTAVALLGLIDGLGMQVLTGDLDAATAIAVFDAQLAVAFGAELQETGPGE
ncbi:TetR/AcrR family transcriptional regulator [Pseudonocardia sp. WMMC193]|uniref:TetR/AcrR family transcriptional regulator n=1 Tax=Pseudonocardia sp. WMMC193 TaxID=2911965 RepID=UPI001F24D134|nr:TetR/AcrR family transcriptional regulator [Pseudonocardia sp. WMMC193]MCF7551531.1 TetR/AcrR family transcriptional regulator [Pseudonocardia sp. WMMC193]